MPVINGIYSGVTPEVYPISAAGRVDSYLEEVVQSGRWSSIVNIVMIPYMLFTGDLGTTPAYSETEIIIPGNLDGYIPRNKKLLTYPFLVFQMDAVETQRNLRAEWLRQNPDDLSFRIHVDGCAGPNPQVIAYPHYYNGVNYDVAHGVVVSDFPQAALPIDSYNAWLAMKSTQYELDIAKSAVSIASNIGRLNLAGATMSTIGMMETMNQNVLAATTGDRIQGQQGTNILVAISRKTIYYKWLSVKKEVARSADDFCDRWGYTTGRLKVPNRNVRPHWCYTKTSNCTVDGEVPGYYARQMEEIYNKGITFWKNIGEVGNYSLDNSV